MSVECGATVRYIARTTVVAFLPEKLIRSIHVSTCPSLVDVVVQHVAHAEKDDPRISLVLVVPRTKLTILQVVACVFCYRCASMRTATMR